MERDGLSSYALAEVTGVSQTAVSSWITKGRVPFRPVLNRICGHFGVRPEWLVDGTGPKDAPKVKEGAFPKDLKADLATLGEAAQRSKDVRKVVSHLAHVVRETL